MGVGTVQDDFERPAADEVTLVVVAGIQEGYVVLGFVASGYAVLQIDGNGLDGERRIGIGSGQVEAVKQHHRIVPGAALDADLYLVLLAAGEVQFGFHKLLRVHLLSPLVVRDLDVSPFVHALVGVCRAHTEGPAALAGGDLRAVGVGAQIGAAGVVDIGSHYHLVDGKVVSGRIQVLEIDRNLGGEVGLVGRFDRGGDFCRRLSQGVCQNDAHGESGYHNARSDDAHQPAGLAVVRRAVEGAG